MHIIILIKTSLLQIRPMATNSPWSVSTKTHGTHKIPKWSVILYVHIHWRPCENGEEQELLLN